MSHLLKSLDTRSLKILDLDLDYLGIQLANGGRVDSQVASLNQAHGSTWRFHCDRLSDLMAKFTG